MKTYKCPVCKKPLSKKEYETALGILGERESHWKKQREELRDDLREAKQKARYARDEGIEFERNRTQTLLKGKDRQIETLKQRIDQLKKGSTPQTEGLEFEDELTSRLKREFPKDMVEHKGHGGDVLHTVKFDNKPAGIIIYECKRTAKIQSQHVNQAYRAKQSRNADFAVLVTTGQRRGFNGLTQIDSVLVVSPLGTIPLVSLLRQYLIEMLRLEITKEERAMIAQRMVEYITSPQFKNLIEDVTQRTSQLAEMIKEEAKEHIRNWRKRWNHYQTIHWDGLQIRSNLQMVLHGKEPQDILPPKAPPLQLPAETEE